MDWGRNFSIPSSGNACDSFGRKVQQLRHEHIRSHFCADDAKLYIPIKPDCWKSLILFVIKNENLLTIMNSETRLHSGISWDYYYQSEKVCFSGGPDLGQQLRHLLPSPDNGWDKTIWPAGLEGGVERRKDEEVMAYKTRWKKGVKSWEEEHRSFKKGVKGVCFSVFYAGPTSNTYSLLSSALCVTPLSTTLSITTERSTDRFTDD